MLSGNSTKYDRLCLCFINLCLSITFSCCIERKTHHEKCRDYNEYRNLFRFHATYLMKMNDQLYLSLLECRNTLAVKDEG